MRSAMQSGKPVEYGAEKKQPPAEIRRRENMADLNAAKGKVLWQDRKHILWFPIGTIKYTIRDDERIYIDKGIFNTVSDQTLIYRVTDIQLSRTFGQKLCGTGTVVLVSKIDADHEIVLKNIGKPKVVMQMISNLIEETRKRHNMIGKEFFGSGGHGGFGGSVMMPPPPMSVDVGPDMGVDMDGDGMPD